MPDRTPLFRVVVLAAVAAGFSIAGTPQELTPAPAATVVPSPSASPVPETVEVETAAALAPDPGEAPSDSEAIVLESQGENEALDHKIEELSNRLQAAQPGTAEVDAVDEDLAIALDEQQAALAEALDRYNASAGATDPDFLWGNVTFHGTALIRLVRLRIEAREDFSDERRRALFGPGRMGMAQAAREWRTVSLMVRYHIASRRHSVDEVPQMARDLFTVGAALGRLILVVLVLAGAVAVRRRWRGWLERLRTAIFRSVSSVASKRRAQWFFRWCEIGGGWVLFLIAVEALRRALGPAAGTAEIYVLLTLLTVFGVYRLAIEVVAAILMKIADHFGLEATTERRAMLLKSVRAVLRIATLMVLVTLASRGLGQGFVSILVMKFAWLVVLVSVLVELFRWRGVMIDTFLKLQPTGRLSATLRATRSRWFGAFLAPAAFLWLAGRGATAVVREFALGFDQTQKALAFFFRQRIQRQAEIQGYAEGDVGELPGGLVEAFAEEPLDTGPMVVQDFPGLTDLHEILTTWRDSGARGSYLLTGERGIGKTTWLNQIRRDDLEIQRIVFGRRVTGASDLCELLSKLLEVDAGSDAGPRELGRALYSGPRRVVVVDMAQHLFLANVGGYEAFSAFAALVNRTCNNVFWLCSMSSYAWRHLRAVRPDATVFRTRRHLVGWSDEKIAELIRTRCAESGVRFNYADLVVDRIEGVAVRSSLIESEEGYTRLLWDYSDGNPRAALHYFVRSLNPDRGNSVRVRLFRAPDIALLEDGGQDGLFVLAAIVTHESISLDDLTKVTRFDRVQCFIHLDRLLELGAITLDDEMYRVSTTWHRAAVRLLRRRNLLPE